MGDFLLDCRPREARQMSRIAGLLQFFPDMRVESIEEPAFGLVLTSPDDPKLWGAFQSTDKNLFAALCGRIALDEKSWRTAESVPGQGGLACAHLVQCYREHGLPGLHNLDGNFVVILFDRQARKLFIVTDQWGLMPAFQFTAGPGPVFASHPDALAIAVGEERNFDLTSFAEFILAARLSAPYTYYRSIAAVPHASVTTVDLSSSPAKIESTRPYFQFQFDPRPVSEKEALADELAEGFRQSVSRRTTSRLGKAGIALSGGLDSRVVLCSAPSRDNLVTFTFFDEENCEFRTARSIAQTAGAGFVPLQRSFDYYADSAPLGARISAGVGCIASNHFLGFRSQLRQLGVQNLLTGCYCDYVFKGLALNKRYNRWTTRQRLAPFAYPFYSGHFDAPTEAAAAVRQRLEDLFPARLRSNGSEQSVLEVEHRRLFPLCYEEDNAERVIPQRVMGWYPPLGDPQLMAVHLKMSCSLKLNRNLFARMAEKTCGDRIAAIPDAGTGARVNASIATEALHIHWRRAKSLLQPRKSSLASSGSWPNWEYYVNHSPKIRDLWQQPNADALEIFRQILGKDEYRPEISQYEGRLFPLFLQLFTLKLWFDHRLL